MQLTVIGISIVSREGCVRVIPRCIFIVIYIVVGHLILLMRILARERNVVKSKIVVVLVSLVHILVHLHLALLVRLLVHHIVRLLVIVLLILIVVVVSVVVCGESAEAHGRKFIISYVIIFLFLILINHVEFVSYDPCVLFRAPP